MKRQGIRFTVVAAAISVAVAVVGALAVSPPARPGVYVGAGLAFALQVLVFWLLAVWLFPGRGMMTYGLGLLGRMFVFGVVALALAPRAGLALIPTLFSLAGVFWVTTMVEPLFLKIRTQTIS